ncbi:hypothetical protein HNQ51_002962 [Inhella inkyongensis]|uniref:GH16 domain-containing protein n=1 Tax=Inhella inkyongensis TaxID=392593 RepID=A0A840S5G9_9BURK|nr:glycoside hydrolase family 16 protein [Inhella inkyongensis]MBB5205635.1 hypothetical protein [Inhella inkyongensis]
MAALFFDDFSQPDRAALQRQGWTLREQAGHPGPPGARWATEGLVLQDDPERPGNRLLRLHAHSDGTAAGTVQSQLCRPQQFLWGSTAARVRFSPRVAAGVPRVQAFFQVSPLRFDYDPLFSELDWEYLPNGGWGAPGARLFAVAWQTVRLEPWDAHNQAHEEPLDLSGRWVQLTVQTDAEGSRWFLDGQALARHGGRTVPRQPMALAFSHWISPGGLLPTPQASDAAFEVDWVIHVADVRRSPAELAAQVAELRAQGVAQRDSLPPGPAPACNF